jgi:hypothetical protein
MGFTPKCDTHVTLNMSRCYTEAETTYKCSTWIISHVSVDHKVSKKKHQANLFKRTCEPSTNFIL